MAGPGGQAKFVEGNLFRHIVVMSLSASVGLMAIFAVDLINMVYISWLGDADLTAAVGYAGAVLFFATAVGIGFSIGATVLVAQAVGALDPVLILWLGWGLAGAATAAGLSRLVMLGVALWPVWRLIGGFAPVTRQGIAAFLPPFGAISAPAVLTQMATPVGQAIVTRLVGVYGEAAVAGMAIAGRLTPVAFAMIFALSGALGPIFGQNLGAGRMDRVARAFRDSMIFTALVIVLMSVSLYLLRQPLADLFQARGMTRDLLFLFCGPLSLLFFFNGLIFVANALCNNLGRPFWSTAINWGRHTLGTLPPALWLSGMTGASGVLIGQALGGVVFGLIAVWMGWYAICHPRQAATLRSEERCDAKPLVGDRLA